MGMLKMIVLLRSLPRAIFMLVIIAVYNPFQTYMFNTSVLGPFSSFVLTRTSRLSAMPSQEAIQPPPTYVYKYFPNEALSWQCREYTRGERIIEAVYNYGNGVVVGVPANGYFKQAQENHGT
jgi:hypothetical protein